MMGSLVHVLQKTDSIAVKIQVIQSVSILMQNIQSEKSLCACTRGVLRVLLSISSSV